MKKWTIRTHEDLPVGKELYLGGHDICNRYLRRADGIIEVQRIVRWGKNGDTDNMTTERFDQWKARLRAMANGDEQ